MADIRSFFTSRQSSAGNSSTDSTDSSPVSKRSKHRQSGFNSDWFEDFPWVSFSRDINGMFCALCQKHSRRPKKAVVGRATWVDVACITLTQQSLKSHEATESHKEAVQLEAQLSSSGIIQSLSSVESAGKKAMTGALKCLYWLCKQEISHTTNFSSLVELGKSLGATYLNDLQVGLNAQYTSERFIQEAVICLGSVVSERIIQQLRASPFFALMVDETTDIAIVKEVIIYARYLDQDRKVQTSFIAMKEATDGRADTIVAILKKLCQDHQLNLDRLVAFGSDGAAVMIGRKNGVAAQLKQAAPWVIANHCVAHRLALATAQAADEIPYINRFKSIIGQLYRFYEYSAVRTAGLKEIQEVLNDPRIKLTEASNVRWLSHEKAVRNLNHCLPSVIVSLEREAVERHDAQALGLAAFVKKYDFVATLLMMCDVLPHLAILSRALQRQDLDYSSIRPLLAGTIASLQNLLTNPGEHFSSLDDTLASLSKYSIHLPTASKQHTFKHSVFDKFISKVIDHLKSRFPDVPILEAFAMFDGRCLPNRSSTEELCIFGSENLQILSEHFKLLLDTRQTAIEWGIFKNMAVSLDTATKFTSMDPNQVMSKIIESSHLNDAFPNLAKLALIARLIPSSTADCERGFSALKRIKTRLRNRLSNRITVMLIFIAVEGPECDQFDCSSACDLWASQRPRRINIK